MIYNYFMKKYNQEFVDNFYKENGCELLEKYTNANTSIKYRCKCGNISQNNFFFFMQSPYCWNCAAQKQAHSQEYVENIFKERGCELLDIYKNNNTRMKFKCKCGEISTITFASFNSGCYCVSCGGKKKLTTEFVKSEIKKDGYELLSKYKNAKTKLSMKCEKGHICEISWNNFQRGKRCRTCFIEEKWHKPEDRPFVLKCRSLLRNCLRDINVKKSDRTEKMLGYSAIQLKEHLSSFPDWDNLVKGEWHIDHIFPIKAFCDYGIKDTTVINCLKNLRPLAGKENMSKGGKYDKFKFEEWLKS